MGKSMMWGELNNLKLEFRIPAVTILSVEIRQQANRHGELELSMICADKTGIKDILALGDAPVRLSYMHRGEAKLLFRGICRQVSLQARQSYRELQLLADSESVLLDREKHTRTFQDPQKKFSTIAKAVLAPHKGEVLVEPDIPLPELVVQHGETDYAFLRRLANTHDMNLFADCRKPQLLAAGRAVFQQKTLEDNVQPDTLGRDVHTYIRIRENRVDQAAACGFGQEVLNVGGLPVEAGDKIAGRLEKVVWQSTIYTQGAMLFNRLTLLPLDGNLPTLEETDGLGVFWLVGRVLEVKANQLRVQFYCDSEQTKDKAQWIDYEHEASNYLYMMPDIGEEVWVCFDDSRKPVARYARRPAEGTEQRKKAVKDFVPSVRMLTNHGRMLRFTPQALELVTKREAYGKHSGPQSMIQFDRSKGIRVSSTQDVLVRAEKRLRIQASAEPVTGLDALVPFAVKEKAGELRYVAGTGLPPADRMDEVRSGIGCATGAMLSGGIKNEFVKELPAAVKRIQEELPGGPASRTKKEEKASKQPSYPSGGFTNLFGAKNCTIKVGSSVLRATAGELSVKAGTIYQLGFLPKSLGGSGSTLGIREQDDYDDLKLVNFPICKRNKKSLGRASSLGKGASGGNVKEKTASGAADVKRRALAFQAVKKKNRSWKLSYEVLKGRNS